MKTCLILCTTHHGLSDETYESVLQAQPIAVLKHKGSACIDIARSIAFDQAVAALQAHEEIDVILNIDDDVVFGAVHAQGLIDAARSTGDVWSGRYATINRTVAAMQSPLLSIPASRYFTGLGFMAIPRAALLEVAAKLDATKLGGTRQWCRTGVVDAFPGAWSPEDVWFCNHFGGVRLATDIVVGHRKTFTILPKEDAGLIKLPESLRRTTGNAAVGPVKA